jgi:hypothetical protein
VINATLTQFLIDVVRGVRAREFASDPEAVIRSSGLDARLQEALRSSDVGALWLAGAHPVALMYFARSLGWPNERYYGCLDAAELKRSDQAAFFRLADENAPRHTHQ